MRNLTIKQKLLGMVAILVLVLVGLSFFFIQRFGNMGATYRQISDTRVPQLVAVSGMNEQLIGARTNTNEILGVERNIDNFKTFVERIQAKFKDYEILARAVLQGSTDLGEKIPGYEGIRVPPARKGGQMETQSTETRALYDDYKVVCNKIIAIKQEELELVNAIGWYDSSTNAQGAVKTLVELGRRMEEMPMDQEPHILLLELRSEEKNILQRADQKNVDRLKKIYQELTGRVEGDLKIMLNDYYSAFEGIFEKVLRQEKLSNELKNISRTELRDKGNAAVEAVRGLKQRAVEMSLEYSAQATAYEQSSRTVIITFAAVVVFVALVFGWFVSGGINKALAKVIAMLDSGANQIASASGQVSSASQQLAEGASEQAASVEETTASLEEISSMTMQNADNAKQADALMENSQALVGQAGDSMKKMNLAMEEISTHGQEISKIIKTIDEIAFQTNLLALNAAVEAARAGEAGMGFAVVADEVRNLAQRSAEAAKNTAELIQRTIGGINQGAALVREADQAFAEVAGSASKVAELVGEIAAASREQAQGVDQIGTAMTQMDKVTQTNAATAEESASASEELYAQAESMQEIVMELVKMVGGQNGGSRERQATKTRPSNHDTNNRRPSARQSGKTKEAGEYQIARAAADSVIPMDDGFDDF